MVRFLFILLCVAGSAAHAQNPVLVTDAELEEFWRIRPVPNRATAADLLRSEAAISAPGAGGLSSEIVINQSGNGNVLNSTVTGPANRVESNQLGDANGMSYVVNGSNNALLMTQTGGSVLNMGVYGNGNVTSLTQDGGGNNLTINIAGDGQRYLVSQNGGDTANLSGMAGGRLELIQGSGRNTFITDSNPLSTGNGVPNLRIEQQGGASLIIQNGR